MLTLDLTSAFVLNTNNIQPSTSEKLLAAEPSITPARSRSEKVVNVESPQPNKAGQNEERGTASLSHNPRARHHCNSARATLAGPLNASVPIPRAFAPIICGQLGQPGHLFADWQAGYASAETRSIHLTLMVIDTPREGTKSECSSPTSPLL